jgi:hypothetical protein
MAKPSSECRPTTSSRRGPRQSRARGICFLLRTGKAGLVKLLRLANTERVTLQLWAGQSLGEIK